MTPTNLETYTVLSPLKHNGKVYQKGETVELDAETAQALVTGPGPTAKKGKWQLGDKEVTEEAQRSNEPVAAERVDGELAANEVVNPDGNTDGNEPTTSKRPGWFAKADINDKEIGNV